MSALTLTPIGFIESPFDEKFSVPRQPNLLSQGGAWLRLVKPFNQPEAVRGLAEFSHLWLIFQFHQIPDKPWHATVRPPRLGGNQRIGVFASRSTHRPNPLGLSKVRLERVVMDEEGVRLKLGGVDLVNGTPIFDIKPYLHYADSEPLAQSSFAQTKPTASLQVEWLPEAKQMLTPFHAQFARFAIDAPEAFISEVIAQDPRPAYQQGKAQTRVYGMRLAGVNVRWQIAPDDPYLARVLSVSTDFEPEKSA